MIIRSDENVHRELSFEGDKFKLKHVERVPDSVLKENYDLRKDKNSIKSADNEWWLVARIPKATYFQWYRKYPELRSSDQNISWPFLKKLLKEKENEIFRTYAGNL